MSKTKKVKKVVADAAFTEGVHEESFKEWFFSKLEGMFVDNIPLDAIKELPPRYMYLGGMIAHLASITCFIFFIYTGFENARNTEFISLSEEDGECTAVTRQNTGQYLATDTGYWEGSEFYDPALAIYKVDYFGLDIDTEGYQSMMSGFRSTIEAVGAKAESQDAGRNIMYWITFEHSSPQYLFQMTGNSIDVFNRYYTIGGLATVEGVCDITHTSTLDGANHLLRMEFSFSEYYADFFCMKAGDPVRLGYNPNYDYDTFRIDIDLNSLLIAVAVGQHVLRISSLSEVPGTGSVIDTISGPVTMHKYFDDRWENMNLIYCFEVSNEEACVVKLNDVYALPVLNHYGSVGTGEGLPDKCDCADPADAAADSYCQIFDFVIGVIFYDTNSTLPLFELISTHGVDHINHLSYNISVDGADQTMFHPDTRRDAYEFCDLSFGPCNVIMFNTFDDKTHSVSDFHYQVLHPACEDTFTVSNEAWDNLMNDPPLPLVERYYSCKPFIFDAMFNSLGIAAGNTATMVPLLCICFLPVLYMYLQASGRVPPKAEYTPSELDAAIKALSLIMLRIRDGKLRGIKKGSVLNSLTKDLISAAKAEGGYPDSDDDSDSDDEADAKPRNTIQRKRRSTVATKSAVFIKHIDIEAVETKGKSGFWGSLFSSSSETNASPASNPMLEMSGGILDVKNMVVLNEDLPGSTTRINNLKKIPPDFFSSEVDKMLNAMHRAVEVQGTDGAAAAYRIAQVKTETLLTMPVDNQGADIDRCKLFMKIYNLLLVHATLEFNCSMDEAVEKHSLKSAYNIGGKVYSAGALIKMKDEEYFSM